MPVKAKKIGDKWRIVKADTEEIAKNRSGTPVDGGGHTDPVKARKQARAINANS